MLNYNTDIANIIYTNHFEKINLFQKLKKEGLIVNTPFQNTVSENYFCFEVGMKLLLSDKNRGVILIKNFFTRKPSRVPLFAHNIIYNSCLGVWNPWWNLAKGFHQCNSLAK